MPDRIHEKLIQRQLAHGSRLRAALRAQAARPGARPRPVVTISRQAGCGSRAVADALGRRLDAQVIDQEIVDHIARDRNVASAVVAALDERTASGIEQWVRGMLDRRFFLQDDYHLALVRAIRTLAEPGGVVLVGRGANFVLAERADLRLRLVADEARRAAHIATIYELAPAAALSRTREIEAARAEFVRRLFHVEVDDPRHYDIVLNLDRLDAEGAAEVAMRLLAQRGAIAATAQA